jgi:uncharacterized membrane protein
MTTVMESDTTNQRLDDPERFARGLGWFSIGLGLAQIAAPRGVARMIGVDDDETNRNTMFAIGVRELASGVGILTREHPVVPVWSRVGGDVMDLALLGRALRSDHSHRRRVAAAAAAVIGVAVLDVMAGQSLAGQRGTGAERRRQGIQVRKAITIERPADEVYRFWRNFENLPRFMQHLERVRVIDARRSRWTARAPAGTSVEWDAEIIEERPNELIVWRSLDGASVPNTGSVRFAPAPHGGTAVLVELRYQPPGGRLAAIVAKLFGEEPDIQVGSDLRRLKQVLELGEVVHSDAALHRKPHPARPSAQPIDPETAAAGGVS